MKFKQVLLTSTAMLMLGTPVAPLFAQGTGAAIAVAQAAPPALAGAIQTYRDAQAAVTAAQQSGGDVAAAEAALASAEEELSSLCAALGQTDIEACIAMFEGGEIQTPAAPAPQEPAAAEEPAPAPAEEAAPVEEPAPPPAQEPAPAAEEPAPVVEEPASAAEDPVADEPAPAPEPAPVAEEPAPAPEPSPVPEEAQEPAEPAPAPEEPETLPAPVEEPAPEAEQPVETLPAPAEDEPAQPGAPASLLEAVAAYEAAVADYESAVAAGGDVTAAAQAVADAEAELQAICEALGQTEIEGCLAGFDIDIEIIDIEAALEGEVSAEPAAPQEEPGQEAPAPEEEVVEPAPEGEAAEEAPAPQEMTDDIVLEGDVQGEIVPEGVDAEAVAPLLDSQKDAASGVLDEEPAAEGQPAADAEAEAELPAEGEAPVEGEDPAEPVQEPAAPVDVTEIPSITEEEAQNRQEVSIQEIEQAAEAAQAATLDESPQPAAAQQQGGVLVGPVREGPSNAEIIATIGLATIFAIGANQFIEQSDTPRIVYPDDREFYYEELSEGRTREVILRADGSQIVTIRDRYGDIIRRSRIEPDGTEILLVYVDPSYRRYDEQGRWIDPGRNLPPLVLNIPPREYVLDASTADEQQVAVFLDQPPVETIQRYYTIEEVQRSARLRDMVRRLEIGDLTFETASANISQSEIGTLSAVANAMLTLIRENPAETFLIEGHTDAVGSDISNLALSDRRAQSVAYALTRVYGVPAENLATQGYGERYLKINTQQAERVNRRVTIRRITPLITPMDNTAAG